MCVNMVFTIGAFLPVCGVGSDLREFLIDVTTSRFHVPRS